MTIRIASLLISSMSLATRHWKFWKVEMLRRCFRDLIWTSLKWRTRKRRLTSGRWHQLMLPSSINESYDNRHRKRMLRMMSEGDTTSQPLTFRSRMFVVISSTFDIGRNSTFLSLSLFLSFSSFSVSNVHYYRSPSTVIWEFIQQSQSTCLAPSPNAWRQTIYQI